MTLTVAILQGETARNALPALVTILRDCVANGASVGFMAHNTTEDYRAYWQGVLDEVEAGRTILLAVEQEGGYVGTAQLQLVAKPNQPHRAEIAKVLVHSSARRQGLGEALMRRAEDLARMAGRDLLVLDTDENGAARRLYGRLGWTEVGTIPRYALMPDGRECGSTFFYKDLRG